MLICRLSFVVFCFTTFLCYAARVTRADGPPVAAPQGYRWVLQEDFSDEFNGNKLDEAKWHDHYPGWCGRIPGRFTPSSVSVGEGFLKIRCQPLDEPDGQWTIACGAVQSKAKSALYGYYECRMRASSLRTSSTFWLKTPRPKTPGQAFVSTELDIQECIGNATRWKSFGSEMISNTHIVSHPRNEKRLKQSEARKSGPEPEWHPINDCASPPKTAEQPAKKEQAKESNDSAQPKPKSTGLKKQTAIGGNVDEAFHTYGCWWKDANTLEFYLDGKPVHTIHPPTDVDERPFSRPMMVNMVCEIYTWEDAPELKNLTDDSKNTTYYDYVRAYRLVPVE